MIKRLINFSINHYIIFLAVLVFISYGQLLLMQPWQEDNVIFFKVTHIDEMAGYLGKGVFGSGVYRYIITPYYIIYKFFGYNIPLYYALDLIFIFISAVCVYILGRTVLGEKGGKLASFLFACGYVAYDGFVRVYNSISLSWGVIFLSLVLSTYWRFYKSKQYFFYFLSILFYFLALELSYIRSHYLIAPIIVFEFLFLGLPFKISNFIKSLLRMLPFLFIFYKEYLVSADNRTQSSTTVVKSILRGNFDNTFSFFSTLGNLFIPDKIQELLLKGRSLLFSEIVILLIFIWLINYLFNKLKKNKTFTVVGVLLSIIWLLVSGHIFTAPTLIYSTPQTVLASFIGGLGIILTSSLVISFKGDSRKLVILFFILIAANIAAYAIYTPLTPYGTGYRYMSQSFIGYALTLVMLVSLSFSHKKNKIPLYSFITFGLILLVIGVAILRGIVVNKSNQIASFYTQLKSEFSYFPKNSLIYFDIQDSPEARSFYNVSFSVAEMPNTTAIAWRYGIDRYDIQMFTEYSDLFAEMEKTSIPPSKIFTFFVTKNRLINTSEEFRKLTENGSKTTSQNINTLSSPAVDNNQKNKLSQPELDIELPKPISSITPIEIDITIKASPIDQSNLEFPVQFGQNYNSIHSKMDLHKLAFDYLNDKNRALKEASYSASSEWKDRTIENLHDNNISTVWQPDRVLWEKEKTYFLIDLKEIQNISGLAWINGSGNNTPIKYSVETSTDGQTWNVATAVENVARIDTPKVQIITFKPTDLRFIRMIFEKTLSGDSPYIAEAWPLQTKYQEINLEEAEQFAKRPFDYVEDDQTFADNLIFLNNTGEVRISWLGNKSPYWITSNDSVLKVIYDNNSRKYKIIIPPGGTQIEKIKLSDMIIPGPLSVENIETKNISLTGH